MAIRKIFFLQALQIPKGPRFFWLASIAGMLLLSCNMKNDPTSIDNLKEEVYKAELAFAEMAKKEGIDKAFLYFAADDAVLSRNNTVISGKKAIQTYFEGLPKMEQSLSWEPDFVDVSASGDMAYTYGKYLYTAVDSNGVKRESKGIFHTVWKRQQDGTWKYVWD